MVMPGPTILLILDGASEPTEGDELTSLERATTPVLDALAQLGTLHRLETTPAGLSAGSEMGCALLLGWRPDGPVDRAQLEAAGRGLTIPAGQVAARIDVLTERGDRADDATARGLAATLAAQAAAELHHLAGHRLLAIGTPEAVDATAAQLAATSEASHRWPAGATPPTALDASTVVIGAPGAATGLAAAMGARTITPPGITGGPRDHLGPLAEAALAALDDDEVQRIVVHVGGPDEAAHDRDADAKVRAIEAADEELLLPLVAALHERGGALEVAIDHGCDPRTGQHDPAPTPFLRWIAGTDADDDAAASGDDHAADPLDLDPDEPGRRSGLDPDDLPLMAVPKRRATATARTGRRLTERWAAPLPVEDPVAIVAGRSSGAPPAQEPT